MVAPVITYLVHSGGSLHTVNAVLIRPTFIYLHIINSFPFMRNSRQMMAVLITTVDTTNILTVEKS